MFRLDDAENSFRVVSDISPNQTWIIVFNAPPNGNIGARIRIETERYLGPASPIVCYIQIRDALFNRVNEANENA